jgi:fibronectin-binding autotransporter adhesin
MAVQRRSRTHPWYSLASLAAFGLFALCLLGPGGTASADTFTWNNTGTDWASAGSWTPAGPPGTTDLAGFTPFANPLTPQTFTNPTLGGNLAGGFVTFGQTPVGGGYTVNGTGNTLTLGNGFSNNTDPLLSVQGAGTTVFSNLRIQVASGTNFTGNTTGADAPLSVRYGSQLSLVNSTIDLVSNLSPGGRAFTLNGGTLRADPTSVVSTGVADFRFNGGGQLVLKGASTGATNFSFGRLSAGSSDAVVTLDQPSGSMLTASFATSGAGLVRTNTSATVTFTTGGAGVVGAAGQPTVALGGTGPSQFADVITESNTQASPYVILTNKSGSDTIGQFAGYAVSPGKVIAAPTTVVTTAADFAGLSFTADNATFQPSAPTTTMTANVPAFTLAITPTANNQTLDLNGNAINSVGIILSTGKTFNIVGGSLTSGNSATAARNVFVVDPGGVLNISSNLAGSNAAFNKAGPGFLVLTGTADQVAFASNREVRITGGVLRGVIQGANANFGSTNNVLEFRGGVFEVDSQGGGSTFSRGLGINSGQVNWGRSSTGPAAANSNLGSGGFSAVNGTLTVNLGGASAPVTWGDTTTTGSFVRDGAALLFGSTKSDSTVVWQNPINLDGGTPGAYQARVIQVTQGTGGTNDLTRLDGPIAGSASTDLVKTGTGVLQLNATNTYAGNTIVTDGTLRITANENLGANPASPTANNILLNGGTLEVAGSAAVTLHANRGIMLGTANGAVQITNTNPAGVTYGGILAGPGELTKGGSGLLALTGANTYSGGTKVAAGTLLVNNLTGSGTGSGSVDVQSGATLGGAGTIAGAVTVRSGGALAPGASPGTLTVNNNVTFENGSGFQVELNGSDAGTTYDQLVIGGPAILDLGGSTLSATFGYTPSAGDRLFLIDNDPAVTVLNRFGNALDSQQRIKLGPYLAQVSYTGNYNRSNPAASTLTGGNDIVLFGFQPTPEPAHVLLLCAVVTGTLAAWRGARHRGSPRRGALATTHDGVHSIHP